jgi:hypothetical protein
VIARVKLGATVTKCSRKLEPGEVKRVTPRGPVFVGYYVGCPACGFVAAHLDGEAVSFSETRAESPQAPFVLVGMEGVRCVRKECGCRLVVDGGDLLAIRDAM